MDRFKSGEIKKIEIPWLTSGNKKNKSWENTLLGTIVIEEGRLILETNSKERTEKGIKLLNQLLGNGITFQATLLETPEQLQQGALGQKKSRAENEDELMFSPEIQEKVKSMVEAHWKAWFDEPIPDLGDITPREAAKTKKGRERLEALFLVYEQHNKIDEENPFNADIQYLRAELGLS